MLVPGDTGSDDDADGIVDEPGEQKSIPLYGDAVDPGAGPAVSSRCQRRRMRTSSTSISSAG